MNSDSFFKRFFRFIISGASMAIACAILVGLVSQKISHNVEFSIVCFLIYFLLSVINYFLQSCWVFGKKGSFFAYIICSISCSGVFSLVNTLVLYFLSSRNLTAVIFAYILSVTLVVPLSYFLNSCLFKNRIKTES